MGFLFMILFLCPYVTAAHADAPALAATPDADKEFEQMDEFVRQENERLKAIKLLSLDLQWADLELRKRKIESKLAALTRGPVALPSANSEKTILKVAGIFLSEGRKEALVDINGTRHAVSEGESLVGQMLVKQISSDEVVLEYPDGRQHNLKFGF